MGMQEQESVHQRVRLFRLASGLSQAAMAADMGVSPNLVGRVESGQGMPSANFLKKMSSELGASVDWIVGGDGLPLREDVILEGGVGAQGFARLIENIRRSEQGRK